jgi:hypothetical protein
MIVIPMSSAFYKIGAVLPQDWEHLSFEIGMGRDSLEHLVRKTQASFFMQQLDWQ